MAAKIVTKDLLKILILVKRRSLNPAWTKVRISGESRSHFVHRIEEVIDFSRPL